MANSNTSELTILEGPSRILEEAKSLDEIANVRSTAEAARAYARKAKLGLETQNRAAILKLRAERKAGAFLARLKLHGGSRNSKSHDGILKLEDLGITPNDSSRWQKEASVPDDDFEQYIRAAAELGHEITQAGLLKIARTFGRARRHKKSKPASISSRRTIDVPPEPVLVIHELQNHRGQLANFLEDLCNGDGVVELERAERRLGARILAEMQMFLSELERLWREEAD